MKKIFSIIISLLMIGCGIKVFADIVTTTRKINPQNNVNLPELQQTKPDYSKTILKDNYIERKYYPTQNTQKPVETIRSTGNELVDNILVCKPYSEVLNTPISGINFKFNVKIHGWINNKCRLTFDASSTGINSMFNNLYGVDPSMAQIMTFEPKVKCEFTKQQLEYVGDSILQEQERNYGKTNNMLKNPSDIEIPNINNLTESDAKLLDIIMNEKACTILNAPDTTKMIESLF